MSEGKPNIKTVEGGSIYADLTEQLSGAAIEFVKTDLSCLKQAGEKEGKAILANANQKIILKVPSGEKSRYELVEI